MRFTVIILIFTCFITLFNARSQEEVISDSKKAIKAYNIGIEKYTLKKYSEAIEYLEEAIKYDSNLINTYFILAEAYVDYDQYENAINTYKKGMEINPLFYPFGYIKQADLEFKVARYDDAKKNYENYLALDEKSSRHIKRAKNGIEKCKFSIYAVSNPVSFNPENLGVNVNTIGDEYWPSLSADEQTLIITRQIKSTSLYGGMQEDFYISHMTKDGWGLMENAGVPLNTSDNEGAQSISADGRLMVFTACNKKGGVGRCDLYYSRRIGDSWTFPKNMQAPVNTRYKETQPSLSADGKTLYFASDRPGGKGQLDIWITSIDDSGNWSKPVNLGDTINTKKNEMSPFIHEDNQTLYFSSDGHIGLGSFDLFLSRRDSAGKWGIPENLGYPINTNREEIGLIVNAKGDKAYYSSDRNPEMGKDIFVFKLYDKVQPLEVSYMKGKVFDKETKKRLSAKFELIDLESGKMIFESISDKETGEFLICLPTDKNYCLNVSKKNYLFFSKNFALKGIFKKTEPFLKDVPLQPIKVGESIILKNIFYETDLYNLKNESRIELDKVIKFLNDYPAVKIEISGHTDNVGSIEYNQTLSEKRAKSVVEYLINSSVGEDRITYKGYGFSQPVASNDTEEGRALNRRTELKIIEN
jgi:flagellar motor protein MotB/tetratricopeptide (TPR) repeat protein